MESGAHAGARGNRFRCVADVHVDEQMTERRRASLRMHDRRSAGTRLDSLDDHVGAHLPAAAWIRSVKWRCSVAIDDAHRCSRTAASKPWTPGDAGRRLEVHHFDVAERHVAEPQPVEFHREVDIVERVVDPRRQAPRTEIPLTHDRSAGERHPRDVPPSADGRVLRRRDLGHRLADVGMGVGMPRTLDRSVGVPQQRPDQSHAGLGRRSRDLAEPAGGDHLGVVVQQDHDIAGGGEHAAVRSPRVGERFVARHESDGIVSEPLADDTAEVGCRLGAGDQHDIEPIQRKVGDGEQRVEEVDDEAAGAAPYVGHAAGGRHDERHRDRSSGTARSTTTAGSGPAPRSRRRRSRGDRGGAPPRRSGPERWPRRRRRARARAESTRRPSRRSSSLNRSSRSGMVA